MACTDALALHEQLGQVLRSAISDGPFPVLNAEGRFLLLPIVSFSGCLRFSLGLLAVLAHRLLLHLDDLGLGKDLVFNLIVLDVLLLSFVLEADDGLDLADLLLYHEQLVHETQL